MATKTSQCQMCNRGMQRYDIPAGQSAAKETYTFVRSPRAILHIQKRYRNPPVIGTPRNARISIGRKIIWLGNRARWWSRQWPRVWTDHPCRPEGMTAAAILSALASGLLPASLNDSLYCTLEYG